MIGQNMRQYNTVLYSMTVQDMIWYHLLLWSVYNCVHFAFECLNDAISPLNAPLESAGTELKVYLVSPSSSFVHKGH